MSRFLHSRSTRLALLSLIVAALAFPHASSMVADSDPWAPSQVVQASDFAKTLAASPLDHRPVILYVGFRTLFEGGHIPGAVFHGTASSEAGLAELKKWAASLPRTADIVIYCGCCPLDRCPNIRPAFSALREMKFQNLRVLQLPKSFASDWVDQGYPIEKGL